MLYIYMYRQVTKSNNIDIGMFDKAGSKFFRVNFENET